ncbi:MAG: lamin tail domain-containing protein [Pirellulales bacterium]
MSRFTRAWSPRQAAGKRPRGLGAGSAGQVGASRKRRAARVIAGMELLEPRVLLAGDIVINEIMYHPGFGEVGQAGYVAEDVRQEYIELLNKGTAPYNLMGWKLTQGVDFTFPDITLGAGEYLVVAADTAAFAAKYPGVTNVLGGWTGRLSNSGEEIELEDQYGLRMADVSYAHEGDWAVRRQAPIDPAHPTWWPGWVWTSATDAGRKSLELVNPALANDQGQNWAPSVPNEGTPGAVNSVASADLAPMVLDVEHLPAIPKSTDPVTIRAKIVDELAAGTTVTLHHRVDGAGAFTTTTMVDDGAHGDGAAGDGIFGAIIPPHANNTIVEFYLQATDAGGKSRTWPGPTSDTGTQGANLHYQVDDAVYAGNQPFYRVIVNEAEWNTWITLMNTGSGGDSDAQMNATFIASDGTGTQVRYNTGVRNRGEGSRHRSPHNMRVNIPGDHSWKGLTAIDLNTQYTESQVAGNAIFLAAGLPAAYGTPVQVRVNGMNLAGAGSPQYGSYFRFEPYNSEYADTHFPDDSAGNIYKGVQGLSISTDADLHYINENPNSYRPNYFKQTNSAEDDWTDLIELTRVLSNTPDATYTQEVRRVADVDEWLAYFAVNALVGNRENSLGGGVSGTVGDDYSLYRGVADPRFRLLVHDMDTVLGRGDTAANTDASIFLASSVPAISRLLKWKDFAPRYFEILKTQIETTFSPERINPLLDQLLGGWISTSDIKAMKDYVVARNAKVLGQISLALTATSPETPLNNYPHTLNATTSLSGKANAIKTRSVLVNGVAATYTPWQGTWSIAGIALRPGINRVLVQAMGADGQEVERTTIDVWYDKGSVTTVAGGTLAANTHWTAAGGPYLVSGSLTVPAGITLTIDPGTSVYLGSQVNLTVASGGRLLAEGTDTQQILFTRQPGSASSWGGITINGGAGTPETRIRFAHIAYYGYNGAIAIHTSGATVFFDHLTFGSNTSQYLSLDSSSFVVQDTVFPTPASAFEPVHGTGGIKSGGRGLFLRNFFGRTTGYSDVIDFTGGNRPGPIVQFIDNVFSGASDDDLDLDGTDAWVQGNIFMHVHKNGSPDTSSAVSGGSDGSDTSQVTVIDNIFYDVDQAAMAKQGNFFTLINNTIVHQTHTGGEDTDGAVTCVQDNGMTEALGMYLEGNIVYDAEKLVREQVSSVITWRDNILPMPWTGPGAGNTVIDPVFKHVPLLSETNFTSWKQAQIMRDWLSVLPNSTAVGTGPNGTDKGATTLVGASISGVPVGTTNQTTATLTVGVNRTGYSIPTAGFPNGSGYTAYKWRVDGGAWSAETPIATPISLSSLANGPHYVEVVGKNDAGMYQDDPILGADAIISRSPTWTVDTAMVPAPRGLLNEILAHNVAAVAHGGAFPDMIELYNDGQGAVDLSDMSITDDPMAPRKFVFPAGTILGQGEYLVLYGDNNDAPGEIHVGFSVKEDGDEIQLYHSVAGGGELADSVTFGLQLHDFSIGRLADGSWGLTTPTFGQANVAMPTGNPAALKINEWLADEKVLFAGDFIELYNPDPLPVALGGLYLTDMPVELPHLREIASPLSAKYEIPPLSFIPGGGLTVFTADSNPLAGADHMDFKLSAFQGMIGLFNADATRIDEVTYGPQSTDVSQGRTPNGDVKYAFYPLPHPGVDNPGITTVTNETVTPIFPFTQVWRYNQTTSMDGTAWYVPAFVDTAWPSGGGLLYKEANPLPGPKTTPLNTGRMTHYFRTHFTYDGTVAANTALRISTVVDDGAIIYLNGREIYRMHMNQGTVTYSTAANDHESALEGPFDVFMKNFPPDTLKTGDNVLAVEVHQVNGTSTDVVWGMTLDIVDSTSSTFIANPIPDAIVALENQLRITELMYNPVGGADYEFLELKNTGATALDLTGVRLSNGVDFTFPAMSLDAGEYVLVVKNQLAFELRYGAGKNIAGQYIGSLNNKGENVVLQLPAPYDAAALRFDYVGAWYPLANGGGRSLVIIDPAGAQVTWDSQEAWRPSVADGGSPDSDDVGDAIPPAVLAATVNGGLAQRSAIALAAIQFSEDVSASLGAGDLTLRNDTTATPVDLTAVVPVYDPATNTAAWNLSAVPLADGWYTATLSGAGVTDAAGNPLGSGNYVLHFFRLLGDTNGDASVDIFDVATLQLNYGQTSGMTAAQGDFDGNGTVDIFDVAMLQTQFGKVLGAMPAGMPAAAPVAPVAPVDQPAQVQAVPLALAVEQVQAAGATPRNGTNGTYETYKSYSHPSYPSHKSHGALTQPTHRVVANHRPARAAWASALDHVLTLPSSEHPAAEEAADDLAEALLGR